MGIHQNRNLNREEFKKNKKSAGLRTRRPPQIRTLASTDPGSAITDPDVPDRPDPLPDHPELSSQQVAAAVHVPEAQPRFLLRPPSPGRNQGTDPRFFPAWKCSPFPEGSGPVRRRRRLESIVVISITAVIWRRRRGGGIKVEENLSGTSKETTSSLAPTFDLARRRFPPGTNQDILKPREAVAAASAVTLGRIIKNRTWF